MSKVKSKGRSREEESFFSASVIRRGGGVAGGTRDSRHSERSIGKKGGSSLAGDQVRTSNCITCR